MVSVEDDNSNVESVEYQIDSTSGPWSSCSLETSPSSHIIESFEGAFPPEGWTFEGSPWTVDELTSVDGERSAVSGDIRCYENESYSLMKAEVTLTESSELSFYWRSSVSEGDRAHLLFCHDVENCFYWNDNWDYIITGNKDWTKKTIILEAGTHSLFWVYEFTGGCPGGILGVSNGSGWVDAIAITAPPPPPSAPAFVCDVASALADGTHVIYVRATDTNGNTTPLGSYATDEFTIDTTPPTFPVQEVEADVSVVPGKTVTVQTQRPTFRGITEPFSHIVLTINSEMVITGETDADKDGRWEWTPNQDISEGTHRVSVLVRDLVGNEVLGEFSLIVELAKNDPTDVGPTKGGLIETGEAVAPFFVVALGVVLSYFMLKRKGVRAYGG